MKIDILKQNGLALIGVLIAVFIIAILTYGIYGWSNKNNVVSQQKAVKDQMDQLQRNVNLHNELERKALDEVASTTI